MPARRYRPTSAGRRNSSVLTRDSVTKNKPEKKLTAKLHKTGGRNHHGHYYRCVGRPPVHVEGVLPLGLDKVVALLGDDGSDYDLMRVHLALLSGEPGVGRPREDYLPRPE